MVEVSTSWKPTELKKHGPKPECPWCGGTGAATEATKRYLYRGGQALVPCVCLFCDHAISDKAGEAFEVAAQAYEQAIWDAWKGLAQRLHNYPVEHEGAKWSQCIIFKPDEISGHRYGPFGLGCHYLDAEGELAPIIPGVGWLLLQAKQDDQDQDPTVRSLNELWPLIQKLLGPDWKPSYWWDQLAAIRLPADELERYAQMRADAIAQCGG